MGPKVTVIIPSYNHAEYIDDAIASVLAQDYENLDLVVVDDGSNDGTRDVLKKYKGREGVKIILNDVNKGQGAVINQALKVSEGEFVCFLPSDDWFLPGKISHQVNKFYEVSGDVGVVYGKGYRFYIDTNEMRSVDLPVYKGNVLERLILEPNFVYPVTPMFRRECFDVFPFDESYIAEGEAIYLKLATRYKFDYVDEYLAVMRDHSRNTGKKIGVMYRDNVRYWTEFLSSDLLPDRLKKMSSVPLLRIHCLKGIESVMIDKDFEMGREAILSAIKIKPSVIVDYRLASALVLSILPPSFSAKVVDFYRRNK